MTKFALALLSISMMFALTGCCCSRPCGGGYGAYYGGGSGGCPGGNCGVGAPGMLPQGAYYNSYDSIQAASLQPQSVTSVASLPPAYTPAYQPTAYTPGYQPTVFNAGFQTQAAVPGYQPTAMIEPLPTF